MYTHNELKEFFKAKFVEGEGARVVFSPESIEQAEYYVDWLAKVGNIDKTTQPEIDDTGKQYIDAMSTQFDTGEVWMQGVVKDGVLHPHLSFEQVKAFVENSVDELIPEAIPTGYLIGCAILGAITELGYYNLPTSTATVH